MKRWVWALVVLLGTVASASPINLCEYQAPKTRLSNLGVTFSYHYYDDPAFPDAKINAGRMSLCYSQIYSAPAMGFSLSGSGALETVDLELRQADLLLSGTYRYYVGADALFAFGGFETVLGTAYTQPGLEGRAGLGYGRFTDVTPLAKAMLIEEDLLEARAIRVFLPDATLLAIAQEIGRRAEYATLSDLVAKVAELIEVQTGVTLDARALLGIEDRILEQGRERFCGGAIQVGLGYELLDPIGEQLDFLVTASADWGIAPEPGSQLLARGAISAPLPLGSAHTRSLSATYDYQLNEMASFRVEYSLWQVRPMGLVPADRQSAAFTLNTLLGGWNMGFQLSLRKLAPATEWTKEFILSASLAVI